MAKKKSPLDRHDVEEIIRQEFERLGLTDASVAEAVHEDDRSEMLSKRFNVPEINLDAFQVDTEVIALMPREVAARYHALPVHRSGGTLIVAFSDPDATGAVAEIRRTTGMRVEPLVAGEASIVAAIDRYYGTAKAR